MTNNELLILGIKSRQKELRDGYVDIASSTTIDISNTFEMNNLISMIKEYQDLEFKLSQLDPHYNEVPF